MIKCLPPRVVVCKNVALLWKEKPFNGLLIEQAKENEIFNMKSKVHLMENTMESQKAEREEVSRLRMAWQFKTTASQPVKQQWGAFKEQLKKVSDYALGVTQP